ncbi:MAG: hypothetical protein ACTS4T_00430 [Candidatus Hodgkinia cicadicola]
MKLCKCAPHSPSPLRLLIRRSEGAFDEFPAPPTFYQTKDEGEGAFTSEGSFWRSNGGKRGDRNVRTMRKRNCSVGSSERRRVAFAFAAEVRRRSVVCADDRRMALT